MPLGINLPDRSKSQYYDEDRIFQLDDESGRLDRGKPTVIQAEIVKISGHNAAPGQSIYIVANLVQGDNAVVDVSGQKPERSYAGVTAEAGSPGGSGQDGDASKFKPSQGANAGSIVIIAHHMHGDFTFLADGGNGGDGIGGGRGGPGLPGADGAVKTEDPQAANAQPGHKGGTGGRGGQAGNGGNGGTIQIFTQSKIQQNKPALAITTSVKRGLAGKPGAPGQGGDRGPPGTPGTWGEWVSWGHSTDRP